MPAGTPPRPAPAARGRGPGCARKDHSLASITDRIVGEFDAANRDAVGGGQPAVLKNADGSAQRPSGSTAPWHGNVPVDALAERLGVKRRRLYDVMNVLEAVGVTERISKGACKWHGASRVEASLEKLRLDEARAGEVEEAEASGDASSLKSLATRLMRRVGASAGAPVARRVRGGDEAGRRARAGRARRARHGRARGCARRLHDVASILIRVGVLAFVEHEGKAKGRGDLKWLGALRHRQAGGERPAPSPRRGTAPAPPPGEGGDRDPANNAYAHMAYYAPAEGAYGAKTAQYGADPNAAAAKQATRLSSFFQRAPAYAGLVPPRRRAARAPARAGCPPSRSARSRWTRRRVHLLAPPGARGAPRDAADAAAAAAALMRSPEWIAQLSMATAGAPAGAGGALSAPSPAAGGWARAR